MATHTKARRTLVALLGGAMLATSVQAQTPTAPADDGTRLSDVTVIGGKIAPTTESPRSATCEFLVATDPFVRAMIQAADGDPMMGPRIYQPTRFPRNVQFDATPGSAPGSALPAIPRQFRGVTTQSVGDVSRAAAAPERRLYDIGSPSSNTLQYGQGAFGARISSDVFVDTMAANATQDFTTEDAIVACRRLQIIGGDAVGWGAGRYEIAYRDKFLPTALALFDDRRYGESLDYFQRAFKKLPYDLGGDEAALMIGKLQLGAPGVTRNTSQAMIWLERAAGARFSPITDMPRFDPREPERNTAIGEASMILARVYQTGFGGVAKDPVQARKWFERALWVGYVPASSILGDIHYFGADTPRDTKKAFDFYKRGAVLGYAPAQYALGEMYLNGDAPGGRNLRQGLAWHNEAAKIGFSGSLYVLAVAYEKGEGVPADQQRALGLYKLAALSGSAPAGNALGTYFYNGRILTRDPVIARRWFEKAAVDGDADAMFNLGAMMMKGEGGQVDRTRAWVWLKIAEQGQHPNAPAAVAVLEARMTADEKAAAAKLLTPTKS